MKTLNIRHQALDRTAQHFGAPRTISPEPRLVSAAGAAASIERQLDEIQRTFGVRWEW